MKKILLVGIALVLVLSMFSVVGCGGTDSPTGAASTETEVDGTYVEKLFDEELGVMVYWKSGAVSAVRITEKKVSLDSLPIKVALNVAIDRIIDHKNEVVIYSYGVGPWFGQSITALSFAED